MGSAPFLMLGLLAPRSLAREGNEAALISFAVRGGDFWKCCALSSLPFSSTITTTKYCDLSLQSKLLTCEADASLEVS